MTTNDEDITELLRLFQTAGFTATTRVSWLESNYNRRWLDQLTDAERQQVRERLELIVEALAEMKAGVGMTVQELIDKLSAPDVDPKAILMVYSSNGKQVPAVSIECGHLIGEEMGFTAEQILKAVFINPDE
jgi:hypothetical protein